MGVLNLRYLAGLGASQVLYLFTRLKFNWSVMAYSQFEACSSILAVIGMYSMILIALKWLKLQDLTTGLFSSIMLFFSALILTLATESWMIYLGKMDKRDKYLNFSPKNFRFFKNFHFFPKNFHFFEKLSLFPKIVMMFKKMKSGQRKNQKCCFFLGVLVSIVQMGSHLISTPVRSLISKCVSKKELGKIFAALGASEACVPLIATPLYNLIYERAVMTDHPGSVFLVSVFLTLVNVLIFL